MRDRSRTSISRIVVNAASKAPSGGNVQPARLLVIRDREKIKAFGSLYHEAWWAKRYDAYGWTSQDDIPADSIYVMPSRLADEMVDTPVVILAFTEPSGVAESSVYPGVQNLLLAARALGIGSVLTTLHPKVMGTRICDVRHTAGNGVSLLHPARVSARQLRADQEVSDRANHVLGRLGKSAALEVAGHCDAHTPARGAPALSTRMGGLVGGDRIDYRTGHPRVV